LVLSEVSGRYRSQKWLELFPKIFNIFFGIKSQYMTILNTRLIICMLDCCWASIEEVSVEAHCRWQHL